jgi:RNA polymerase sigma-70 factor, ECF subfamily
LARANGQTAIAYYQLGEETGRWAPVALDVLTFDGDRISEITAFVTPKVFPRFGLPAELAPVR